MRRIALAIIPLSFVACNGEPTAPARAQLSTPQAITTSVVAAAATSTEFDGFVNFCNSDPLNNFKVTPGGTVHFQVSNRNQWVTGNPLIDGIELNTGAANINPDGPAIVTLKVSLKPDAVNGTWEIVQQVRPPYGSTGVGHGTGDLQGMTIKFTTEPPSQTSVCNPDMGAGGVHGVILSPAS
jgi:hypothetical protein